MNDQDASRSIGPFLEKLSTVNREVPSADRAELTRLILLLSTALGTCHSAFMRQSAEPTEENHVGWTKAVQTLASVVESLSATLHVFNPNLFDNVAQYTFSELYAVGDAADETLQFVHYRHRWSDPEDVDFEGMMELLGSFIRENFSMNEVFEASTRTSSLA